MTDTILDERDRRGVWSPGINQMQGLIYHWPPRLRNILIFLKSNVRPISLFHLGLVLITWFFLTPDLGQMQVFAWEWILLIYLRNVGLLTLIWGTLH